MKIKLLLLSVALSTLFNANLFSQTTAIEWQNTIGGSGDDILTSIQPTADSGYIIGGFSYSGISGDKTEAG